MNKSGNPPVVGIIMGSLTDHDTLVSGIEILEEFKIPYEVKVVSAHRTPDAMFEYAQSADQRGIKIIIAAAGGAAHLPGMVASITTLPVIGVPVFTSALSGVDSLYSIVQMPAGVPVATVGIGNAANAALLAIRILATGDKDLQHALEKYRSGLAAKVDEMNKKLA